MDARDALDHLASEIAELVPDEMDWTLVMSLPGNRMAGTILTSAEDPTEAISRLELVVEVLRRAERMRAGAQAGLH